MASPTFTDEQITHHYRSVQDEAVEGRELLGEIEPLSQLAAEYTSGSEVYHHKIALLEKEYPRFLRSRGDGNCFFRAFAYGWYKALLTSKDTTLITKAIAILEGSRKGMEAAGYDWIALEDFYGEALALLQALPTHTPGSLRSVLNVPETSNAIVCYLRFASAAHLRTHPDDFAPFIEEEGGVPRYCERSIEAFGQESEQMAIIGLVHALHVPVDVVYLDGRGDEGGSANVHHFGPEATEEEGMPRVSLLYRPGHYDLLYSKEDASGTDSADEDVEED